ncbi:MAG: hypothetical protein RL199_2277 [Pseudomonadota bacterium]|jgi:hypothetical protein
MATWPGPGADEDGRPDVATCLHGTTFRVRRSAAWPNVRGNGLDGVQTAAAGMTHRRHAATFVGDRARRRREPDSSFEETPPRSQPSILGG